MSEECKHVWYYQQSLLLVYPPKQRRICGECGKRETVQSMAFVPNKNQYEDLNKQFHGGPDAQG